MARPRGGSACCAGRPQPSNAQAPPRSRHSQPERISRLVAAAMRPIVPLDTPPVSPLLEPESQLLGDANPGIETSTLILLDWDDTLLPTTWLSQMSCGGPVLDLKLADTSAESLARCEAQALRLLDACCMHAHVVITTNSEKGWVESSGSKFMPKVASRLINARVPIFSAQAAFRSPGSRLEHDVVDTWKRKAFHALLCEFARQQRCNKRFGGDRGVKGCNLLSIGDSEFERDAARYCAEKLALESHSNGVQICKTVKLEDDPSVAVLRLQQAGLAERIRSLVHAKQDLDADWDRQASQWQVVEAAASFI